MDNSEMFRQMFGIDPVDLWQMECEELVEWEMSEFKESEWWVFTFGSGQLHGGYYVKIRGTYIEAREKMIKKYGLRWGFQYSWKEWEYMQKDIHRVYPLEKELEVIE